MGPKRPGLVPRGPNPRPPPTVSPPLYLNNVFQPRNMSHHHATNRYLTGQVCLTTLPAGALHLPRSQPLPSTSTSTPMPMLSHNGRSYPTQPVSHYALSMPPPSEPLSPRPTQTSISARVAPQPSPQSRAAPPNKAGSGKTTAERNATNTRRGEMAELHAMVRDGILSCDSSPEFVSPAH